MHFLFRCSPKPLDQEKVPADVALWQILAGSPGLAIQLAGILPPFPCSKANPIVRIRLRVKWPPSRFCDIDYYARMIKCTEIEVQDPEPLAIPWYQELGFDYSADGRLLIQVNA